LTAPLVTVLIPARNERSDIGACLEALAAQDLPLSRIEVLVVDGASADGTADEARAVLSGSGFARAEVLSNPEATTPSNLNLGLAHARGEFLCRVDARSVVPRDYVRRCVEILEARADVAVVGGAQVPEVAEDAPLVARGIARALRNPLASGLARYRRGASSGPSDTVYLGSFRTDELRAAGGWDIRFGSNQDYELNQRLRRSGLVWFEAGLSVAYRPRTSLAELAQQFRRFGRWKAAGWLEAGVPVSGRQLVLLAGPPLAGAAGIAALRRHPLLTMVGAFLGLVAVDSRGGSASSSERAASMVAIPIVGGCWWLGIAEQALRFVAGQRLLGPK